jgi:hypothetical protein
MYEDDLVTHEDILLSVKPRSTILNVGKLTIYNLLFLI